MQDGPISIGLNNFVHFNKGRQAFYKIKHPPLIIKKKVPNEIVYTYII